MREQLIAAYKTIFALWNTIFDNYSGWLIKAIGLWFVLDGIYRILIGNVEQSSHFPKNIYYQVFIILIGFSIVGGLWLIWSKHRISWSIVVIKSVVLVIDKLKSAYSYFELFFEEESSGGKGNDLLDLVSRFDFSPKHEMINRLYEAAFVLIVIGVLHNSRIIEIYKVNKHLIYISILVGILISCLDSMYWHYLLSLHQM